MQDINYPDIKYHPFNQEKTPHLIIPYQKISAAVKLTKRFKKNLPC